MEHFSIELGYKHEIKQTNFSKNEQKGRNIIGINHRVCSGCSELEKDKESILIASFKKPLPYIAYKPIQKKL